MKAVRLFGLVVFAIPSLASFADAEPAGSSTDQQVAHVTVRSEQRQNLRFEINPYLDDGASTHTVAPAVCGEPCNLTLSAGSYRLRVTGPADSDIRAGEIPIEIQQDSEVTVKTASQSRRALGLTVGIAGSAVAAVAGTAVLITAFGSMSLCDTDDCRDRRKTLVLWETISLGAMAVGATAAVLGWIAVARNNAPSATVVPTQARRLKPRLSEVGILRAERAWGFSASARF